MKLRLENLLSILSLILLAFLFWWGFKTGILTDQRKMQEFVSQFGSMSVIVIIILQILQVVFPIVPGGLGMVVATLLFGIWWGFIINYISISVGSIIAFQIGRRYGRPLIKRYFSENLINKYEKVLDKQQTFDKVFTWAILLPIAPDDFLCYFAGTTKMSLKKFTTIILLAKPPTTFIYSMGLHEFFELIRGWIVSSSLMIR